MITITGTVGSSGKYLVTGMPVDTEAHAILRIAFENNTSGTPREVAERSYLTRAVQGSNS